MQNTFGVFIGGFGVAYAVIKCMEQRRKRAARRSADPAHAAALVAEADRMADRVVYVGLTAALMAAAQFILQP